MGRLADEHLPEVVPHQPSPLPEVVPDSSPEATTQQQFHTETEKYPAHYDDAPKLPHEQPVPGSVSPGQHFHQPWGGEYPISAVSPGSSVPWQSFPPGGEGGDDQTYVASEPPQPEKRICGMRRRLFIIIAVIVGVIVVAAAVGGGVGGAMASRKASSDGSQAAVDGASSSSTSSAAPTSTTATSAGGSSTSSAPKPSLTNLATQTDPALDEAKFSFQGWSGVNNTGPLTSIYQEEGYFNLPFRVRSYIYVLPKGSWCCVTFCENLIKSDGYTCSTKRQPEASADGFNRVSFWCGKDPNKSPEYKARCSDP